MSPDEKRGWAWEGEKSLNPSVTGNHCSDCISNTVSGILLYSICVVQKIPGQEIYTKLVTYQ